MLSQLTKKLQCKGIAYWFFVETEKPSALIVSSEKKEKVKVGQCVSLTCYSHLTKYTFERTVMSFEIRCDR